MMNKAITILEISLMTYENNFAINMDEGNWQQAELEHKYIKSLKKAIAVLKAVEA